MLVKICSGVSSDCPRAEDLEPCFMWMKEPSASQDNGFLQHLELNASVQEHQVVVKIFP